MTLESEQRARVVATAKTWLRTPYIHMGRVKGAGCDCATLLAEVYHEAGLIPEIHLEYYSPQWHLHRDAERYLQFVFDYAGEVAKPSPGDVALWKFGRAFSHGAIVVEWPLVIHAYVGSNVCYEDAVESRWLSSVGNNPRPHKFLSYWAESHELSDHTNNS